jgi:hypothetical protein
VGLTIACFLSYINNYQQTAAHNVVVDKLNGIEGSLCEIQDNLKWFKPNNKHRSPKPTKPYEGDVLALWNEFKKLFDAKRKLNDSSLSEMYCKVKGEIDNLEKGTIGTSTLENFYKCKTNPKSRTLSLISLWVENERRDHSEGNHEN